MSPLIAIDKDIAETLLGRRPGRPTISRRVGGAISDFTNGTLSEQDGTDLFHLLLLLVAAGAAVKYGPVLMKSLPRS